MKQNTENKLQVQNEAKQEAGLDLFRILELLFINSLHACLYNGFYNLPQTSAEA